MANWPSILSFCPSYVRLDHSLMRDVDGRVNDQQRYRPWPDAANRTAHADLTVESMCLHHFEDKKAIMVSTGSPDKPRTSEGQIASYRNITFRNLDIGPLWRNPGGPHMDHIWLGGGHDPAIRPDVVFEDLFLHDANQGVMPVLFDCGDQWDTVVVRRVATLNCASPFTVKLDNTTIREFIIEDCPRLNICFQGWGEPLTVRVRNSPGIRLTTPRDALGRMPRVTVVTEQQTVAQPMADVRLLLARLADLRQQEQAVLDQISAVANS